MTARTPDEHRNGWLAMIAFTLAALFGMLAHSLGSIERAVTSQHEQWNRAGPAIERIRDAIERAYPEPRKDGP